MLIFNLPVQHSFVSNGQHLVLRNTPRPPEVLVIQCPPWIFQGKRGMREREKEKEGEREGEGDFSVNPKSLFLSLKTELLYVCQKSE